MVTEGKEPNDEFDDEFANAAAHAQEKGGDKPKVDDADKEIITDEKPVAKEEVTDEVVDINAEEKPKEDPKKEEGKEVEPEVPAIEDINASEEAGKPKTETEQDKIIATLLEENAKLKESPKYASPIVAKINDYIANGGEINQQFWELQSKDYSSVDTKNSESALNALKDLYKFDEGLDDTTVEKILRKEFPILTGRKEEDEYDEDDKDDELVSLMRKAKNAIPKLQEIQDKAKLPESNERQKEAKEKYEKAIHIYKAQSRQSMNEYEGLTIELDDTLKVRASLTPETRKFVESIVTEPQNQGEAFFIKRYRSENGTIDYNKFASEMQLLSEFPQISRKIFQQGLKRGEKAAISRELRQEPDVETRRSGNRTVHASSKDWQAKAAAVIENNL
jgi:hypothetical protein